MKLSITLTLVNKSRNWKTEGKATFISQVHNQYWGISGNRLQETSYTKFHSMTQRNQRNYLTTTCLYLTVVLYASMDMAKQNLPSATLSGVRNLNHQFAINLKTTAGFAIFKPFNL